MACSISSGKPDEGAALGPAYTLEIVHAARADAAFDDKENPLPKNLLGWTPASSPESKFTPLSGRDRGKRLCLSEALAHEPVERGRLLKMKWTPLGQSLEFATRDPFCRTNEVKRSPLIVSFCQTSRR